MSEALLAKGGHRLLELGTIRLESGRHAVVLTLAIVVLDRQLLMLLTKGTELLDDGSEEGLLLVDGVVELLHHVRHVVQRAMFGLVHLTLHRRHLLQLVLCLTEPAHSLLALQVRHSSVHGLVLLLQDRFGARQYARLRPQLGQHGPVLLVQVALAAQTLHVLAVLIMKRRTLAPYLLCNTLPLYFVRGKQYKSASYKKLDRIVSETYFKKRRH